MGLSQQVGLALLAYAGIAGLYIIINRWRYK